MRTTAEVLDHHLKCFAQRDLAGTMVDYAPDALFFRYDLVLRVGAFFEKIFAQRANQACSFLESRCLSKIECSNLNILATFNGLAEDEPNF